MGAIELTLKQRRLLFHPDDTWMPQKCDVVYGTAVVSETSEIAVLYWARSRFFGIPLVLLDYDVMNFGQMAWQRPVATLDRYRAHCGARLGSLGLFIENEALAAHVAGDGLDAAAVPDLLAAPGYWEALNLAAAYHVNAGHVKATNHVFDKAGRASIDDALNRRVLAPLAPNYRMAPRDDDPTIPAYLYGVVLGLDETAGERVAEHDSTG